MDLTGALTWARPSRVSMKWELKKGDDVIGAMSPPHTFGTSVTASFGADGYNIRKGGIRHSGAAIWKVGSEDKLATMVVGSLGKDTVIAQDGSTYQLSQLGSPDDWILSTADGKDIFSVHRETAGKKPGGVVDVKSPDPHLSELLLLCWFVISTSER
ncbi:hypothetical protein [Methanomassiliicoccus luminyensis]|uniref:hypothetical protein n=1 Tax=Methanomassiliicoccus luminyensis TaxID=1080712 RepID=UPI0003605680|nr:hypothetical protein [Methanomassiliicoccus luminyensis]